MNGEEKVDGSHGRALRVAAIQGNIAAVNSLLAKGVAVDIPDPNGWTALMMAAMHGRSQIVRLLLDRGAAVDAKNSFGGTPLRYAAKHAHTEIVSELLDRGADPDAAHPGRGNPLIHALSEGNINIVKALLDGGSDPNARAEGEGGKTALSVAVSASKYTEGQSVRLLLEHGADANARDPDGSTALMYTSDPAMPELVALLVAAGAYVNATSLAGETPLSLAHFFRDRALTYEREVLDMVEENKAEAHSLTAGILEVLADKRIEAKKAEEIIDLLYRAGAKG